MEESAAVVDILDSGVGNNVVWWSPDVELEEPDKLVSAGGSKAISVGKVEEVPDVMLLKSAVNNPGISVDMSSGESFGIDPFEAYLWATFVDILGICTSVAFKRDGSDVDVKWVLPVKLSDCVETLVVSTVRVTSSEYSNMTRQLRLE